MTDIEWRDLTNVTRRDTPTIGGTGPQIQRRPTVKVHQAELVTAAAAAVTVYGVAKTGFASRIPAFGGVSAPIVMILLGGFLAVVWDGSGTTGDIVEGVGYGLIAFGALAFASAA